MTEDIAQFWELVTHFLNEGLGAEVMVTGPDDPSDKSEGVHLELCDSKRGWPGGCYLIESAVEFVDKLTRITKYNEFESTIDIKYITCKDDNKLTLSESGNIAKLIDSGGFAVFEIHKLKIIH